MIDNTITEILKSEGTYKEIGEKFGYTENQIRYIFRKNSVVKSTQKKWTTEEEQYIRDNYTTKSDYLVGKELARSAVSVQKKRLAMGLDKDSFMSNTTARKPRPNEWTENDRIKLRRLYGSCDLEVLSEILGKDVRDIKNKAIDMGITRNTEWSEAEESFLKEWYQKYTVTELSYFLDRTEKAVTHKINKLALSDSLPFTSKLEDKMVDILKELGVESYNRQVPLGRYKLDFVVNDVVIEVNGDYWHCNPKIYTEPISIKQFHAIEKDKIKLVTIRESYREVLVVWEHDLLHDREGVLNSVASVLGINPIPSREENR